MEEAVEESETAAAEADPTVSGWGHDADEEDEMVNRDWLSEVEREERATLEWPATRGERPPRERIDTPRVRHLFPVPDDAEWEVRELEYDRRATGVS